VTEAAERDGGMRSYEVVAVVLGLLVIAVAVVVFIVSAGGGSGGGGAGSPPAVVRVVVPPGGPTGSLVPERLAVRVGDSLVIENRDRRQHQVGPYVVGAGQTLRQTFADPGTYIGVCTVNASGRIEIVVSPR
jgi:plastocyanin